jgi:hypothetical protein
VLYFQVQLRNAVMSQEKPQNTLWSEPGQDKVYEYYRLSSHSQGLRDWVDEAYCTKGLASFLDRDFIQNLRNVGFYSRLWELELAEWFQTFKLNMIPANGRGPDFCIDLGNGSKVWIEATLSRPDEELEKMWKEALQSGGKEYNTPRQEMVLRYSSSLFGKANVIKEKYLGLVGEHDFMLIAVSAFPPGSLYPDIEMFMHAVFPIEDQLVYFSQAGSQPNQDSVRPTHTILREYVKKNGALVKKEFLYPGDNFPFIDGVVFSEASNLQELLGTHASSFDDSTNQPHLFPNYSGKSLPELFTKNFYFHKITDRGEMVSLELQNPT